MIDAAPRDVGDMQQSVNASEIHERAVVGDVLHDTIDHLTFFKILHQLLSLLGARLFEYRAARDDDVAAPAIHLQDLKLLRHIHQWSHIADRADVDLGPRKEGHGAIKIDREAALHLIEDDPLNLLAAVEGFLQFAPAFLASRFVARQHGFAERVLDPLEIDFNLIADLEIGLPSGSGEFAQRHASLGLQTDVDDGEFLFDADDPSFDDGTFLHVPAAE